MRSRKARPQMVFVPKWYLSPNGILPEVDEIFVRLLMADTVNAPLTDRVVELLREKGQGNQFR